jgi:hypothetical protein
MVLITMSPITGSRMPASRYRRNDSGRFMRP